MNDFQFISYIPTPNDKYGTLGLAKVLLYGKVINYYKYQSRKDSGPPFVCMGNYTLEDSTGEKKYLTISSPDSTSEKDFLMDYIRNEILKFLAKEKSNQSQPQQQPIYYPHGMAQQSQPQPTSMSEVASQEQLPF